MRPFRRIVTAFLLIVVLCVNALPCGPEYLAPVFDYTKAPESPYLEYAAGKLGIVKPTYNRSVLYAAYRYLNGGAFNGEQQKALIEVWEAEFNNEDFRKDDEIGEAVKAWISQRKNVVESEEKTPAIYVEREYGGYDFFPNCTKNAFEVATETLSSRSASYGSDNKDVKAWIAAQDKVFQNCASGKETPEPVNDSMPQWLQKDRAYQIAAAEFYSMDYEDAKRHFLEIAMDDASPWKETADYLVGRTLIRQASLSKDGPRSDMFYTEAEQNLSLVASRGNKFSDSANRMLGLVKYRLRPQERLRELSQNLTYGSGEDFRQNVIDYNWLLDKFEKDGLEAVEKRKKEAEARANPGTNTAEPTPDPESTPAIPDGYLSVTVYLEDMPSSLEFRVKIDATDEETVAEAEKVAGRKLSDAARKNVIEARQAAYSGRFSNNRASGYEGGYYGEEQKSLSSLPGFLRFDPLTDWLFTYQIENEEAYLYSLSKFRQDSSDLWLMTALSKAHKTSLNVAILQEAAAKVNHTGPAYPTIAFHSARLFIEQGKTAEARKLIDEFLESGADQPQSTTNIFYKMRMGLGQTMEDFIKYSLRKPFAFSYGSGRSGTIDYFIAQQKSWYDPKNGPQTQEEYEKEVEENWKMEREWQGREMLDTDTIDIINAHFPLETLLAMEASPALPDYLRGRFALPIFTRALMLNDLVTLKKIAPQIIKNYPSFEPGINEIFAAKTPVAVQNACLFMLIKNPVVNPYVEYGLGRLDNEFDAWGSDDWWCGPYEEEGEGAPAKPARPAFLTVAQARAAQLEKQKIKTFGDAPEYLGKKTLEWAKRTPADKRVPEALNIMFYANGWVKYGCGGNEELRTQIENTLRKNYPQSDWTRKLDSEEQ